GDAQLVGDVEQLLRRHALEVAQRVLREALGDARRRQALALVGAAVVARQAVVAATAAAVAAVAEAVAAVALAIARVVAVAGIAAAGMLLARLAGVLRRRLRFAAAARDGCGY